MLHLNILFGSVLVWFCMEWLWNCPAAPGSSRYWRRHVRSVSCRCGGGTRARPPADGCEPAIMASSEARRWATVSASSPALLTLLTWLFSLHTHTHTAPFHPLIFGQLFLHPDFNSNDHVILIYIICHVMITLITFKQRKKHLIPSFLKNLPNPSCDWRWHHKVVNMFRMEYCIQLSHDYVACLIQHVVCGCHLQKLGYFESNVVKTF